MGDPSSVFGFYVEKEYVGKRVKGSKVKVTWKFAYLPELKTNELELKHSLVFGKREIKLNGQLVFHKKKLFSGDFKYDFSAGGHHLCVSIKDEFEGYVYDLRVDGCPFHRLTRINLETLEDMRKNKKEASDPSLGVKKMAFDEFVGDRSSTPASDQSSKEKSKAAPKGQSSQAPKKNDSDSSDSDVEEDLWKEYQQNRKFSGDKTPSTTQAVASSAPGWGSDPFSSSQSSAGATKPDVNQLVAGLEGLDFSTPSYTTPSYNQQQYNQQQYHSAGSNPFGASPQPSSNFDSSLYSSSGHQTYGGDPYRATNPSSVYGSAPQSTYSSGDSYNQYGSSGSYAPPVAGTSSYSAGSIAQADSASYSHSATSNSNYSPYPAQSDPSSSYKQQPDTYSYSSNPYGPGPATSAYASSSAYTASPAYQPQSSFPQQTYQSTPQQPPAPGPQYGAPQQYNNGQYSSNNGSHGSQSSNPFF